MLPVKFSDFLQRKIRRGLLIEINPYQILVAGISRLDASPAVLDCAAEFDREDEAGLRQWLGENFDDIRHQALSANLSGLFKLRIGDYRVIYSFDDDFITIHQVGHRRDIYSD